MSLLDQIAITVIYPPLVLIQLVDIIEWYEEEFTVKKLLPLHGEDHLGRVQLCNGRW